MGSGGDLIARQRLFQQALEHGENLTRQNDGTTVPLNLGRRSPNAKHGRLRDRRQSRDVDCDAEAI